MMLDNKQFSQIRHQKNEYQSHLSNNYYYLDQGYLALYHNKIPMDLKYVDYQRKIKEIGNQLMLVKIYSYGNKANIAKIKIQVENEFDPFFHLLYQCDTLKYKYIQQQHGIHADFQQFPTILIKCFNKVEEQSCSKVPQNPQIKGKMNINLEVGFDGKAKLLIFQNTQYKHMELMCLQLSPQKQQQIQKKIGYNYQEMKKKIKQIQNRLAKIQQIIKVKNPTLLTQIFKTTHGQHTKLNVSGI